MHRCHTNVFYSVNLYIVVFLHSVRAINAPDMCTNPIAAVKDSFCVRGRGVGDKWKGGEEGG